PEQILIVSPGLAAATAVSMLENATVAPSLQSVELAKPSSSTMIVLAIKLEPNKKLGNPKVICAGTFKLKTAVKIIKLKTVKNCLPGFLKPEALLRIDFKVKAFKNIRDIPINLLFLRILLFCKQTASLTSSGKVFLK